MTVSDLYLLCSFAGAVMSLAAKAKVANVVTKAKVAGAVMSLDAKAKVRAAAPIAIHRSNTSGDIKPVSYVR